MRFATAPLLLSKPKVVATNSPGEGLPAQLTFPDFREVVTPPQRKKLATLIQDLRIARRLAHDAADLHELARSRIEAPHEILEWAKGDRRWSFTLAEVMTNDSPHANEWAIGLVVAIADELEDESEIFADDSETFAMGATRTN